MKKIRGTGPLKVEVIHVPAADAEERIRRAYALILKAAARIDAEEKSDRTEEHNRALKGTPTDDHNEDLP